MGFIVRHCSTIILCISSAALIQIKAVAGQKGYEMEHFEARKSMANVPDVVDLADELAEIARTTTDPVTGARLMEVVKRLLEHAGLPPGEAGGGELPAPQVSEPAYESA